MTKMQAYDYCQRHGAGFIANVVLNGHSRAALKLKAMASALRAGHTISLPSFSMPDTGVWVDGRSVSWDDLINDTWTRADRERDDDPMTEHYGFVHERREPAALMRARLWGVG